jgi:predicted HTH transcriptional regulator
MARLLQARNPKLSVQRSLILAEICVNATNALILLALRSNQSHYQEIITEIEALLRAYLRVDAGDEVVNQFIKPINKLISSYGLNSRQSLILNYAFNNPKITIKNCEHMFPDVSRRTLQRDLKTLSDRQLLLFKGNTDQRCYQLNLEMMDSI